LRKDRIQIHDHILGITLKLLSIYFVKFKQFVTDATPLRRNEVVVLSSHRGTLTPCGAVAADAAIGVRSGALPGAPPPRAGAKSVIFNHSSSLINPLRASYSSPVHASGKTRGPGASLLRGPRYNHAERTRSSERSEGFGFTSRIDGASTAPTSPIDIGTGV